MKALLALPLLLAACGQKPAALEGRPCPVLPAAEFQRRAIVLKNSTDLGGGAVVRRQFGNLSCDGGRSAICELSAPGVVHVRVKDQDSYFQLPVGTRATLSISGGDVRCVRRD